MKNEIINQMNLKSDFENGDNEDVNVLKAKEIVITNFYYQNEGLDDIRFGDLTFGGKLKSIIALFVPKFRLQM